MPQVMIKGFDHANTKVIDLLAEVDKVGNVLKVFDYNGNQLTINLDGTVMFNKTRWRIPEKIDLK
ncbi:hypothetical protein [Acinetobacter baumannii]